MSEFVELLEAAHGQPYCNKRIQLKRYHHADLLGCTGEVQYPKGWIYYGECLCGVRFSLLELGIDHPVSIPDEVKDAEDTE